MVDICNQSDCIIKNQRSEIKGMQEKEKIHPSRSHSGITQQAWWCQTVILRDEKKKSIPQDHSLASLGKPRDAWQWPWGRIFLSIPHTHDRF